VAHWVLPRSAVVTALTSGDLLNEAAMRQKNQK